MQTVVGMLLKTQSAFVKALISYDPEDPYCIEICFYAAGGRPSDSIAWYMSRDLIRDGLTRRTGEGDVQVEPSESRRNLYITLKGDEGQALLVAPRQVIQDFLNRTAKAVPYGRESEVPGFHGALDAELSRILANSL